LTNADDIFNEIEQTYEPERKIYGQSEVEQELIAMLEDNDQLEIEENQTEINSIKIKNS